MRVQSFLEILFLNTDTLFFNSFQEEQSRRSEDVNTCLSNGILFNFLCVFRLFDLPRYVIRSKTGENTWGRGGGAAYRKHQVCNIAPKCYRAPFPDFKELITFFSQLHWSVPYTTSFFNFITVLVYTSRLKCRK